MASQDTGAGPTNDGSDTNPATPIDSTGQEDYTVPTPLPSTDYDAAVVPEVDSLTEIDIFTTPIKDSRTLKQATLDEVFTIVTDDEDVERLVIPTNAPYGGLNTDLEFKIALRQLYYDATVGYEAWRERTVFTYRIVDFSTNGDYLTCQRYQGDTAIGDVVKVMKSYHMRQSTLDGKTRNGRVYTYSTPVARSAYNTSTLNTENQEIVPEYWSGDEVAVSILVDPFTVDGDDIHLLDSNGDARAWAAL